uniref:hypothetical protein n=1 Tax=Parerythrobacter lutipelagi TaxID=1964208 RepID=UPI0010F4E537|nr:hypothetical protein [Parerythrobacter lutipelagi]
MTQESNQVVLEIIRVLTIITFVYVFGHIIAYLSSQLIEKTVDRFFGKISTAILISSSSTSKNRNTHVRREIKSRSKNIYRDNALFSSAVRGLFHTPNFPIYVLVYIIGVFGYFDTRVPHSSLLEAQKKYKKHICAEDLTTDVKWFKPLEYFVINRIPSAVPRMYNYLVIAGLFRSLSFVFLSSCWWVIIYLLAHTKYGTWPLPGEDLIGDGVGVMELFALSSASVFSLMAYLKFQRRYAEEAILALAYWNEGDDCPSTMSIIQAPNNSVHISG